MRAFKVLHLLLKPIHEILDSYICSALLTKALRYTYLCLTLFYKKDFLEFQRDASAELTSKDESHLKVSFSVLLWYSSGIFQVTFHYSRCFSVSGFAVTKF